MKTYRGNGKLLLTGEYVVLDGAVALALPTRLGQTLEVRETDNPLLHWKSFDEQGKPWVEAQFAVEPDGPILIGEPSQVGKRLESVLEEAWKLNPQVLSSKGFEVTARLEFPRDWGLGSSSTLIYTLAQWLGVDPYLLLENSFGGSGYDIAAAGEQGPFIFQRTTLQQAPPDNFQDAPAIRVRPVNFDPAFKEELFFVHLNRKQNSRHSIAHYKNQPQTHLQSISEQISSVTHQIISCDHIDEFEALIASHEQIISALINIPTIKASLFPDYRRGIKSLGGWGGDFILATGGAQERAYFKEKGYNTLVEYDQMVLGWH